MAAMTTAGEIRDSDLARALVLESLATTRLAQRGSATWQQGVRVALEVASHGAPLLPVGFLADLAHVLTAPVEELPAAPTLGMSTQPAWVQRYEDYVLGKLFADSSLERAASAVLRYQGREQDQAIAFVGEQIRQRAQLPGIVLSPGVLRLLAQMPIERLVETVSQTPAAPEVADLQDQQYEQLIGGVRDVGDLLGGEDLFELEHRTAIAPAGERLALRQVLSARETLLEGVSRNPPRHAARAREVPTRLLDENAYPVGGFSSISTRGTIESLLHSQLAYMEPAGSERPDMFDIKFLRDELLYYARDENQFFRRRRTFLFVLLPELLNIRVKDQGLPYQRLVLTLGIILAAIERLLAWLGDEALTFQVLLLEDATRSLAREADLMRLVLREQIANGTASVEFVPRSELHARAQAAARQSLCQMMLLGLKERRVDGGEASTTQIVLDRATPTIVDQQTAWHSEATALEAWREALQKLLEALR